MWKGKAEGGKEGEGGRRVRGREGKGEGNS